MDNTLWSWGQNEYGQLGNGEMTYNFTLIPYNIVPKINNWLEIYSSPNTAYYVYAQTLDGKLYSWGRSKLSVLGNGLNPTGVEGIYNGDFNVPIPTRVDPLNLKYTFSQTAYTCLINHTALGCSTENIPVDFCTPSHCQSNTICQLYDNGYRFQCNCTSKPTLTGITCDIMNTPINSKNYYSCNCINNWGGYNCVFEQAGYKNMNNSITNNQLSTSTLNLYYISNSNLNS